MFSHSTHAVTYHADTSRGEAATDGILRVDVMLPVYHNSASDSIEWGCPAVLDALPASVDRSNLRPLHFVEALHWSRFMSFVARWVHLRGHVTTRTFQLKSHSCEKIGGVCMARIFPSAFSSRQLQLWRMRGLHEPADCMHEWPGCVHTLRPTALTGTALWTSSNM